MNQKFFIYCGIVTIALASCVSKKKYVELESQKKKSDQHVVSLKKELASTQKELEDRSAAFDKIREDLEYNNIKMLSKVDDVSNRMALESKKNEEKSGELEELLFVYKNESRQLSTQITSLNKTIEKNKAVVAELKKKVEAKTAELIEVKYNLNNEKDKSSLLNKKISSYDKKVASLEKEKKDISTSIEELQGKIKQQKEEIERLQNNVKLLKQM